MAGLLEGLSGCVAERRREGGCGGDPGEGGAALDQGGGWGGVVALASYLPVE